MTVEAYLKEINDNLIKIIKAMDHNKNQKLINNNEKLKRSYTKSIINECDKLSVQEIQKIIDKKYRDRQNIYGEYSGRMITQEETFIVSLKTQLIDHELKSYHDELNKKQFPI